MGLALALALITSDCIASEDQLPLRDLKRVASCLELMDEREDRYFFEHNNGSGTYGCWHDLQTIRKRYEGLKDAPPVLDACYLPPKDVLNDLLSLNRAYSCWLAGQLELDLVHGWEISERISVLNRIYARLDLMRDVQTDYYYLTVRRWALLRLAGDYRVPPPIPLEYYQSIER